MNTLNRKRHLEEAGYKPVASIPVYVPYQLWHLTLLVEYDRQLRLVEETSLQLVEAGVTDRHRLAELLGLEGDEAFRQVLIDLLRGTYLTYQQEHLALTPLGRQVLMNAKARVNRHFGGVAVLYDPFIDEFGWYGEQKLLTGQTVRESDIKPLPEVAKLDMDGISARHQSIQELIGRKGIPGDPSPEVKKDLLLIEPVYWENIYKRADLELWRGQVPHSFDWRLLQVDLELLDETRAYKQLEDEDVRIIPKVDSQIWPIAPLPDGP